MKKIWIDLDEEADVLYISFQRPRRATDSEMMDNGILLRYNRDNLVGITVLDASSRKLNKDFMNRDLGARGFKPSKIQHDCIFPSLNTK